jgi:DNA-binding response OmpR family regulator
MKILFGQTNAVDLDMVEALMLSEGHELISVSDGNAVMAAMQENPDMVLMDANLAQVSGFECCRLIKHDEKKRHIPVILLMSTQDATAWARFSECSADDFIEHPLHPYVIKAKIKLLWHIQELYHRLEVSHRHAEQEIRLAKHMFDTITKRQPKEIDFLHFWSLSAGHFCGDLFIFERTPDDHLHVFLGDFTGHGLSAAMGALPISDIFFSMTRKGCDIGKIVEEMNHKLYEILPTGKFCSATLLRLEADYSKLEIWNGGLPPLLLVDSHGKISGNCESFHLPLGIVDPAELSFQTKQFDLSGVHSVVLCSDGLIEAQNALGEYFGEEKLAQMIASKVKGTSIFNRIKSSVLSFLEGLEPHDDVSLVVIHIH